MTLLDCELLVQNIYFISFPVYFKYLEDTGQDCSGKTNGSSDDIFTFNGQATWARLKENNNTALVYVAKAAAARSHSIKKYPSDKQAWITFTRRYAIFSMTTVSNRTETTL